jgi:hypothetical protein
VRRWIGRSSDNVEETATTLLAHGAIGSLAANPCDELRYAILIWVGALVSNRAVHELDDVTGW